ncbi:MAG: GNAT family N-acetyltransferase [Phycisphaerales bacterium]|nr:MAG: GNAT family N-acetyltransferase [Phycisphaerales bacterium]
MTEHSTRQPDRAYTIRTAFDLDQPVVIDLYENGRLSGQTPEDDPDSDIRDINRSYLAEDGGSALWVAESPGTEAELPRIVGMIGVRHTGGHLAEIRRLRVDPGHRGNGLGSRLMETALAFCRDRGYLKIKLDTRMEREQAIALFQKHGFYLTRTRDVGGKQHHEFYLDLYRDPEG